MHTHRQRIRLLTAAAALAFGTIGGALAAEPGKLLVWINGDKGYNGLQKLGDKFAKKTGVQVVVEHPEDVTDKFQQAAATGKGPDILIWAHDRFGEWTAGGLIAAGEPEQEGTRRHRPAGAGGRHLRRQGLGLPDRRSRPSPDLQQGAGADAAEELRGGDRAGQEARRRAASTPSSGTTTTPTSPSRCWPPTAATPSRRPTAATTRTTPASTTPAR